MNMNTTVRGGLIRLVAGPVAAFAIVGAAVGLSAVTHASTAADSGPRTSVSVEHTIGGPGTTGHGAGPKGDSSTATADPGNPNTATVSGDGGSAGAEQGDGNTATAHGTSA